MVCAAGNGKEIGEVSYKVFVLPYGTDIAEYGQQYQRAQGCDDLVGGQAGHEQTDGCVGAEQQVDSEQAGKEQSCIGGADIEQGAYDNEGEDEDQRQIVDHHRNEFPEDDLADL